MRSKDLAVLLRKQFGPKADVTSPFPKQVVVYGLDDQFEDFEFKGVSVEFRPASERPSMYDGPRAAVECFHCGHPRASHPGGTDACGEADCGCPEFVAEGGR